MLPRNVCVCLLKADLAPPCCLLACLGARAATSRHMALFRTRCGKWFVAGKGQTFSVRGIKAGTTKAQAAKNVYRAHPNLWRKVVMCHQQCGCCNPDGTPLGQG